MPLLKISDETKRQVDSITADLVRAIREGAFHDSDKGLVDAVGRLALTARYLAGLEHAGDRAILTTDVEIESIKAQAEKVAKAARAQDNGEPLGMLADQLRALADQVHKVRVEQIAL
jgi:hypothetical protein